MDNSNNQNSPNNPTPAPPFGAPSQPPADPNASTSPAPVPPALSTPPFTQPTPTPAWPPANPPIPSSAPDATPVWAPPLSSSLSSAQPSVSPIPQPQSPVVPETGPTPLTAQPEASPAWPNMPAPQTVPPAPPPTFTPPASSPLDNPWGTPVQQPTIDTPQQGYASPVPNPIAPDPPILNQPEAAAAPTDLSHLINNNSQPDNSQNPAASAETLVVPSPTASPAPDVPTIPSEQHKGIPKWLIGVGAGLLIIVAGASAYFILGIGQTPKTTTSIPAQVAKTTVKTPPPIATPVAQPTAPAAATESANFGQLQGSQTPSATSAADLLKQRQQQGR